jgi:hypothetical protein
VVGTDARAGSPFLGDGTALESALIGARDCRGSGRALAVSRSGDGLASVSLLAGNPLADSLAATGVTRPVAPST